MAERQKIIVILIIFLTVIILVNFLVHIPTMPHTSRTNATLYHRPRKWQITITTPGQLDPARRSHERERETGRRWQMGQIQTGQSIKSTPSHNFVGHAWGWWGLANEKPRPFIRRWTFVGRLMRETSPCERHNLSSKWQRRPQNKCGPEKREGGRCWASSCEKRFQISQFCQIDSLNR